MEYCDNVIISIKPKFVASIRKGKKLFEFRKLPFRRKVAKCFIYESWPTCKIVGEFVPDYWLGGYKDDVWAETWKEAGITRDFYDEYFAGSDTAYALHFKDVVFYECPRSLPAGVRAPQSFIYTSLN